MVCIARAQRVCCMNQPSPLPVDSLPADSLPCFYHYLTALLSHALRGPCHFAPILSVTLVCNAVCALNLTTCSFPQVLKGLRPVKSGVSLKAHHTYIRVLPCTEDIIQSMHHVCLLLISLAPYVQSGQPVVSCKSAVAHDVCDVSTSHRV